MMSSQLVDDTTSGTLGKKALSMCGREQQLRVSVRVPA